MPALQENSPFLEAVALATRFPGVELGTAQGTPALTVDGRLLARLRLEAEGWLLTRCEPDVRARLLQETPHAFHVNVHLVDYPMVLIDLTQVARDTLATLLEEAWRRTASPARIREYENAR